MGRPAAVVAATALALGGLGAAKALTEAETVAIQTFTNVVTYTIPTVTQTVTVTTIAPTPQPLPVVSRTNMGLPCCGISYPIWDSSRSLAFDFDEMKAAHAKFVRIDYLYNHSSNARAEAAVDAAVARGMGVDLILDGSRRADDSGRVPLAGIRSWAQGVAAKFGSRVKVYEVYNEPDLNGWTPSTYVPVLKEAYAGVKVGNAGAVVSTGGSSKWECGDPTCYRPVNSGTAKGLVEWVKGLYAQGAKAGVTHDAVAVHLYDEPWRMEEWNGWYYAFGAVENVRGVMDAKGETGVPLWSSENGLRVSRGIDLQAQVAREHVRYVKQQVRPIANTTWYTLQDNDVAGYGLLDSQNQRRPSASAAAAFRG
jgi:hypothetical protein